MTRPLGRVGRAVIDERSARVEKLETERRARVGRLETERGEGKGRLETEYLLSLQYIQTLLHQQWMLVNRLQRISSS